MFGAFRPSASRSGGLLWWVLQKIVCTVFPIHLVWQSVYSYVIFRKDPWRLSGPRKQRVRERLRNVDEVIEAVQSSGVHCKALDRVLELPKEEEMLAKDKYTTFSRTGRDYRKSVHKVSSSSAMCANLQQVFLQYLCPIFQVPKWTRLTLRTNPRGF